jgi:hypothetical protein
MDAIAGFGELDPDAGEAATDALVRRAAKESKDG